MPEASLSVHALRRRWKPVKERLLAVRPNHPTSIRLHRAFSWIARAESAEGDPDVALLCLWIAFNAVYGRWDVKAREPVPDRVSWGAFVGRLLALDSSGRLSNALREQRELVMSVLDDEYLSAWFWEEPSALRAGKSRKSRHDAKTWYIESKWAMILDRVLERIYLMRCQLVHGASTHGGKLNRESLKLCGELFRRLVEAVLLVMIDDEGKEVWGAMCYPPLRGGAVVG